MLKATLIILLSISLMTSITFAQEERMSSQKIVLETDNTAYVEGDVITVTGSVEKVIPGLPISLTVFFGKNLIQVSQVNVSQDGEFTDTFTAAGPQWQNEGVIIIRANYGDNVSTELTIDFFMDTSGTYFKNYEVKIPNAGTFDVPFTIKGGNVSTMTLNQKNLSLEIDITTDSDGVLDIKLFRDNIDSFLKNGEDIDFIVLIYEQESSIPIQTEYEKVEKSDDYRAISIPIKKGDNKIEVIGTHVVPEFGTIAMIVLAVAIVSIIALSAKSRLSIMPRI
tara:strand:- start:1597 stop:2436 length:840 start_codon:yes stop_codon:yes gene_type:complete